MKILLVPSADASVFEAARTLRARLVAAGLDTYIQKPAHTATPDIDIDEIALVVPMGGDGTFLSAARLIDFSKVPLLGLNYGTLGFMSGNPERDEVELIFDALAGDLAFEHRATIDAHVSTSDGETNTFTALNELAYSRGISGHMVKFSYAVNGTHIARLSADGIVVATATGSTAYALSAGGPIVSPSYAGMLVVPLAPHTLRSRALVLAPSDVLELDVEATSATEACLFVDGCAQALSSLSHMTFVRGEREVVFARGGGDFFENVSHVFFGE